MTNNHSGLSLTCLGQKQPTAGKESLQDSDEPSRACREPGCPGSAGKWWGGTSREGDYYTHPWPPPPPAPPAATPQTKLKRVFLPFEYLLGRTGLSVALRIFSCDMSALVGLNPDLLPLHWECGVLASGPPEKFLPPF